MVIRSIRKFARHDEGAIAPIYALALFGLIGMAGVGFDYARLMALDTELQNAADQLALAAATQLDEQDDSITRAQSAARGYFASSSSGFTNLTRISNIDDNSDGKPWFIENVSFRFWEGYDRANDAPTTEITDFSDGTSAHIVEVQVAKRSVQYALTPIVGAIAGDAGATAMATMDSAYCKVPPMMVCQPYDGFGATDTDTGAIIDAGKGLVLHMLPNKTVNPTETDETSVDLNPGIFGFLTFPYPRPEGVNSDNTSLGWEVPNPGCTGETTTSEPGVRTPEASALNSRFDLAKQNYSCLSDGTFCPAKNVTKNRVAKVKRNGTGIPTTCPDYSGPGKSPDWVDMTETEIASVPNPGYARDTCHIPGNALGTCTQELGDGDWDVVGYMLRTHGIDLAISDGGSGITTASSRYDVYKWEAADPTNRLKPRIVAITDDNYYCAYPKPIDNNGFTPATGTQDRRVMRLASVDCTGLKGRAPVTIERYLDVFLIEPADTGGAEKEFYVEVIGEKLGSGNSGFQNFAKKKAVLIR